MIEIAFESFEPDGLKLALDGGYQNSRIIKTLLKTHYY